MNKPTDLQKVLDYYQVSTPLPEDFRKYVFDILEKNFEEILKIVRQCQFCGFPVHY